LSITTPEILGEVASEQAKAIVAEIVMLPEFVAYSSK
jgi:hypothetical protein